MEIYGIGTDIVECLRIREMIDRHGEQFIASVYTEREIRYCQRRKQATEHFAGRWAAKEAVLKSLGTGWRKGMAWTDIEVRNWPDGRPQVVMAAAVAEHAQAMNVSTIVLSISHCRAYATATAIALTTMARPTEGDIPF